MIGSEQEILSNLAHAQNGPDRYTGGGILRAAEAAAEERAVVRHADQRQRRDRMGMRYPRHARQWGGDHPPKATAGGLARVPPGYGERRGARRARGVEPC